jgi:hypothetical protein
MSSTACPLTRLYSIEPGDSMIRRSLAAPSLVALTVAISACAASKSADPLSPTVAGPIPGVNITAPTPVDPQTGTKIPIDKQPLTLTVQNAATSGVRPLTYVFEVATDTDFTNKVYSRDAVAPGDNGRTALRLPDPLATGRSYYWRSRAQDGANTGPYSSASNFNVFTPIVIDAPLLVAPINNVKTENTHPRFQFVNAPRSGPIGPITYVVEIADSDSFANKLAIWTVAEQPNQTSLDSPQGLADGSQYFWHARAYEPTTIGPWSATQAFQTPAPIAPPPGPLPGPPPPSGPVPNDAINLGQARVYNSPPDIASWAVTSKITSLSMSSAGLSLEFTTKQSWPDVVPPGFTGPLQYTVWAVVNVNGQWNTSGFIQMWRGRESTGAPILSDFARNWAYDGRWGPMAGYQPHVGEQMGFFVSAGNARGESGVSSVRERSNVVIVALPPGDNGVFTFSLSRLPFFPRR